LIGAQNMRPLRGEWGWQKWEMSLGQGASI